MKPGAKGQITVPPLSLKGLPKSGGDRVIRFIHRHIITPKGSGALKPFRLRTWQKAIIHDIYDDPRPQTALLSIPRGNGKTSLVAALAVYELFATGVESPTVVCVASDERQARLVFDTARRMIELDEHLAERAHIYKDHIRIPQTDGTLRAYPSEEAALQGLDFTAAFIDELHVVTVPVWEAVLGGGGKRERSFVMAISTPAADREGIMWQLVEQGRLKDDPDFRLIEYAAPDGCELDDVKAWKMANPALGDFLKQDHLRASLKQMRPSQFRRYRLGQWTNGSSSWLPWEAWQACSSGELIEDGREVVLGFDGSASGDSTVLVAATVEEVPHVELLHAWENPNDPRWRVPRGEVIDAIRATFDRLHVVEMAADPWGWRTELEQLEQEFPGRVLQWPTNLVGRMGPATDRFYAAVMEQRLTHSGDVRLSQHISNAVAKPTTAGDVIVKDNRMSRRRIDAAVAAIVAVDRAAYYLSNTPTNLGVMFV